MSFWLWVTDVIPVGGCFSM